MLRTAVRNVLAHKARLLMTVLAVMLGVAFVSGTLVFTSTVSDAYQRASQKGFDQVDVAVTPEWSPDQDDAPGASSRLSQDLLEKAAQVPGAASASGAVSGFAALAGKDGKLVGGDFTSQGRNYYPGPDGEDSRYPMRDGRAPEKAGEVALDARTAERTGFHVGDTVRLSVDGPVRQEKVTGVFTTDDGNAAAGGSLTLFDTATAQKLYAAPGEFDEIYVKAAPGTSQAQLKERVDAVLPKDRATSTTGRALADDEAEHIAEGMSGMRTSMLVFAGISLFVGVFLIANTFTMLVAQRTKELALMRAVGASRRQVTRSVLIEAFLVGTVAAVAGLAAGVGIGAALRALMGATGQSVPDGPLVVSPGTVLVSLVVGVVVTVLAAWLPGRRAAKIPPVAAMNSVHATPTTKSLVLRNTVGALVAAAGAALVVLATGLDREAAKVPMGAGAVLLVIGVFVLTPLLSRPLIAAAAPVLRVFGVSGRLARQNAVRNPRRTATTASALMIGLTLITGMTVIAGSVQKGIDEMSTKSLKADYVVNMVNQGPLSPDVAAKLAADPKVTASSPLRDAPAKVDGAFEYLTGVDAEHIGELTNPRFKEGSFDGLAGDKAVVDTDTAKRYGWHTGSTFTMTYGDGQRGRLTVSGVYEADQTVHGILLDTATLTPHKEGASDLKVLVKTEGGPSDATKDALEKKLGENPAVSVQDKQDVSEGVAQEINLLLNVLYGLLAMAVVVAVLGVVNTLAMSVFERSQEIGMLRAIGLDRRGIKRMVRLESLVISLFGGVLGIGLGVFFGWAGGKVIADSMDAYEMVLPWGRMALFLALAALVGVAAALWPARRAARLNMLAAIKAE